jgi:hypothetical protein
LHADARCRKSNIACPYFWWNLGNLKMWKFGDIGARTRIWWLNDYSNALP